jgi:hypothetical protein
MGSVVWRAESDRIGYAHRNPLRPEAVKHSQARAIAHAGDRRCVGLPIAARRKHAAHGQRNAERVEAIRYGSEVAHGRAIWMALVPPRICKSTASRAVARSAGPRRVEDAATLLTVYLRADESAQREALEKYDTKTKLASNQ